MQFLDLGFIEHGLRILMAWLCSLIYPLITWLYDLFIYVSKVNILSNDMIQPIYQRVTLILTIIMVFYVTFEFVKYIVQPDGITDKEKGAGKIIYKLIAVVVLIAFVPSIFTGAYKLQSVIVEKNIIGKVVLGTKGSVNENFGGIFASSIFTMFYSVDEEYANEECDNIPCGALVGMNVTSLRENGTMPYITVGLGSGTNKKKIEVNGETQKITEAYINFDGLFAVLVGAFILYILALYCVDLGVRWAQLIYLQVIAPIPIIGFLAPKKDGIFQKWWKQCLTTFLDLFLRIAIMNFIILICGILLDPKHETYLFENLADLDGWVRNLVRIVLVLGLLLFAQKAPKLLGELFPKMGAASGNFGLKAGERVAPMAARAIGGGLGAAGGLIRGGVVRAMNRAKRNKQNGITKPIWTKEGREQREKARQERQINKARAKSRSKDNRNAQQIQNNVSDAEFNKAKGRVKDKANKVKEAEAKYGKNSAEAQRARDDLKRETESYRALAAKRSGIAPETEQTKKLRSETATARSELINARQELDNLRKEGSGATKEQIAAAEQRVKKAESNYTTAQTKLQADKASRMSSSPLAENARSMISAVDSVEQAKKEQAEAQKKLEEAEASGDEKAIEKAKKDVTKASQKVTAAEEAVAFEKDRYRTVSSGDVQAAQTKSVSAWEQVAKDQNEREASVLGSAVTGALSGAWTGLTTGAQATKLEEVWKKSKEGWAKGAKVDQELNKFYDNGGRVGIQGFVDRTVAKVEKTVGLDTEYTKTMMSTKPIEKEMKEMDAQISLAKDAGSAADNADSVARGKSKELKSLARAETIKTGLYEKGPDGKPIIGPDGKPKVKYAEVAPGETTGEVVRKYHGRATLAKSEADAATNRADLADREAQEARSKANKAKEDPSFTEEQREALEEEARRKEDAAVAANDAKGKAAQAAQEAQFEAEQVEKNAARDEITQILSNPNGSGYHAALVQKVTEGKESLRTALANPQLRELMRQEIYRTSKTPEDAAKIYNAFLTQNITDFDTFDAISTAYKNVASAVSRSKADASEQVRQIQTSSHTQAQKAAEDYNGSGK